MLPKWHILFGIILCILIYFFFNLTPFQIILIFFSSILIDLDHYFRYIIIKKDLDPINFWEWSIKGIKKWNSLAENQKSKYKLPLFIFHGIEFWIILVYLSFVFPVLIWVLIGIAFHMFVDLIDLRYRKFPLYFKFSQIYVYLINRNKKFI